MDKGKEKKIITDEEYNKALNNPENKEMMKKASSRYQKFLDQDERHTCELHGLWKALRGHVDGLGNKFTTSLYQFIIWECQSAAAARGHDKQFLTEDISNAIHVPQSGIDMNKIELKEYIEKLNEEDKSIIQDYYFERKTMQEIGNELGVTKQRAAQKVGRAKKRLAEICQAEYL